MALTTDLDQDAITTAVRAFVVSVAPAGTPVVLGQVNRVPPPKAPLYVILTPTTRPRLSTVVSTWDVNNPDPANLAMLAPAQMMIQCDIFGANAFDLASTLEVAWRSPYGCAALDALNPLIQPLYADEPRQLAFIDGNQQYEDRWSVDLNLQINQTISVSSQFADTLEVGLIEVDSTYPP